MSYYQYVTSIYVSTFCIYISFSVSYGSYTSGISTEICKQFAVTIYIQLKNHKQLRPEFYTPVAYKGFPFVLQKFHNESIHHIQMPIFCLPE